MKGFTKEEKAAFNKKAELFQKTIEECETYGTVMYVDFKNKCLTRKDDSQEYVSETVNFEELKKEAF